MYCPSYAGHAYWHYYWNGTSTGETAPLLMIGMVAFIVDIPGIAEPSTALPVQIFMWADFAERMFVHKTSARS